MQQCDAVTHNVTCSADRSTRQLSVDEPLPLVYSLTILTEYTPHNSQTRPIQTLSSWPMSPWFKEGRCVSYPLDFKCPGN